MLDLPVETTPMHEAPVVSPSTPVPDAAQHLRDPAVRVLLVCDEDDTVVGVVTESDVVALVAETDDLGVVARCMSAPVRTIRPSATVREAAERMRRAGVKHLPVVDHRDVSHGVVSRATLAPYCSRRSLDVTWTDDPLEVEIGDATGVPAND